MHKIEQEEKKHFWFLTSLPVSQKNVSDLVARGRMRWKIENEGFNMQKRNGYYLEHLFSKKYQGIKNHYYLIQIGHMISEILESWAQLWEGIRLSIEQKHQKLKDSFKIVRLKEYSGTEKKIQIRLQQRHLEEGGIAKRRKIKQEKSRGYYSLRFRKPRKSC